MNEEQVKAVAQECCISEAWVRDMVERKQWPNNPADFLAEYSLFALGASV